MALHGSRSRRPPCIPFVISSYLFISVGAQNWGNGFSQNQNGFGGMPSQDMSNQNFPQASPYQNQNFQADPRMFQQPDQSINYVPSNLDQSGGQYSAQQLQPPFAADSRQLQSPVAQNQPSFANPADAFSNPNQLPNPNAQFGGQGQFGNPSGQFGNPSAQFDMGAQGMNSQFGGNPAGRFAGIPDAQQGALPQLPNNLPMPSAPNMQFNAPNLPNFKEPEFNFAGLEKMSGMGGNDFGGGFGSSNDGFGGGRQQNGPVGPGQMAVPGLPPNNPLQQLAFGSQVDDRLSGAPLDGGDNMNQNQPSLFLGLQSGHPNNVAQFGSNVQQLNQQGQQSRRNNQNRNNQNSNGWVGFTNQQSSTSTSTEASAESADSSQVLSQSQESRTPTGQQVIATVKEVPLEVPHKKRRRTTTAAPEEATTEHSAGGPEVLPADGSPSCGFHGLEKWQKSPCESCTCHKGVTNCEKVKCTEKPDGPNCIPVYHFTTCCPTFQCSNSSRGQLPTLETSVQEGDDCSDVGEFVPVSVKNPCLACKCNTKLKIQCKTISCPPKPRNPTCKLRVPQNPGVCCPEFDCIGAPQQNKKEEAAAPDDTESGDNDNTEEPGTESSIQIGHSSSTSTTMAPTTSTSDRTTTEEDAIVVKLEEATTSTKRLRPFRTTTRATSVRTTATTTEEPDVTTEQAAESSSRPAGAALHTDDEAALEIQSRQFAFGTSSTRSTATTTSSTSTTTQSSTTSSTTTTSARVPPAEKPVSEKGLVRDCQGGWKFPAGCDVNKDCSYIARWKQNPIDQTVRFKITTREPDNWTGIGFTTRKNFENVDMVVGWEDKAQKIIIQDRHGNARQPLLDTQQSLSNLRGVRNGASTTIEFSRRQRNNDINDVSTDDSSCPYFVFPVRAGGYDTFTMAIQPHIGDPEISDVGVCITQCRAKNVNASASSTTTLRPTFSTQTIQSSTTAADTDYDQSDETTPHPARKAAAVSGNTGGQCASEGAVMALNPCQNCTCLQGQIRCTNIKCPDSWTQHLGCQPLYKVGVCCPTWQCPTTTTHQPIQTATRRTIPGAFPTGRPGAVIVTVDQLNAIAPPQQPGSINITIEVPKNPDKLLLLSKKEFMRPAEANNADDTNTELEQVAVVPDRMGVVTPPKGWTEPTSTTTTATQSLVILTDQGVQLQKDGCLNFACGTNATCVVSADNSPSCVCRPGYEGNARLACVLSGQRSASLCVGVKCGRNAQCFNIGGQPQCKCQSGFDGDASVGCVAQRVSGFVQPAECILRSEIGSCQNFGMRWQFDTRITGCRQFVYSGCAGNDNNFESRMQCEQRCLPMRHLLKDIQCSPDDDIDNPACSRCECAEQGVVACVPISCNAAPNRDCKPIWKDGECCPHYDCSQGLTGTASGDDSSRSGVCAGVTCREPQFKPGCTRVTLPGDCCPTIQCAGASVTVSTSRPQQPSLEVAESTTQTISPVRAARPGVPCSLDEKISSSSPCLNCQCVEGITMCSQISCPPITPDQRRRCRITQLPNQCCLSVECPDQNRGLPPTTSALRPNNKATAQAVTTEATTEEPQSTPASTLASTVRVVPASTTTTTTTTTTRRPSTTISTTAKPAPALASAPVGKVGCSEKSDFGGCTAQITRWFFNPASKKCETYIYSGCGGNKNRYLTEERCKAACK